MRARRLTSRLPPIATAVVALVLLHAPIAGRMRDTLPSSLSDREFWSLTEQLSEPDGYFRSNSGSPDNLLSNENTVSTVATALAGQVKPGGVYLGVGPEQNFTYISAIKPRIAFITDIRRGNLHLHLMYKALFEMSADRADFVARLFSRTRPAGLPNAPGAAALMNAYLRESPVEESAFKANLKAIVDHLTRTRRLPLPADDRTGIEYVYRNFHRFGPAINYTSSINGRAGSGGSYAAIMSATDASGIERTYLANEFNFAQVKLLQSRNLVVPVVGDFAGPKALRSVGTYLRDRGAVVSAFYVSNVEMYLQRNGVWMSFCANVAALPLDAASVFIRPGGGRFNAFGAMASETAACRQRSPAV
jgi:hypothetical protein